MVNHNHGHWEGFKKLRDKETSVIIGAECLHCGQKLIKHSASGLQAHKRTHTKRQTQAQRACVQNQISRACAQDQSRIEDQPESPLTEQVEEIAKQQQIDSEDFDLQNLKLHPVKCGYCDWLIQGCRDFLQHKCLKHYDEHIHRLKVDENFVVTLIPRPGAKQCSGPEEIDNENVLSDEVLIEAVSKRPALYNMQLPVKDRTKLKINSLWLEISNTLGGIIPEVARKRWQYLRDCYVKEKKKMQTYTPSVSAAGTSKKPSFRYYDLMKFVDDSLSNTQTMSNIAMSESPDGSDCSSFSPIQDIDCSTHGPASVSSTFSNNTDYDLLISPASPPRTPTPGRKKRKMNNSNFDLRSALINVLQQPVAQPDAVDGMLVRLGYGLRRLPYRERTVLEIKFLTMLMEAEERLDLQG